MTSIKTIAAVLAAGAALVAAPAVRADSFSFSIGTPVYGGYAPAYIPTYAPPPVYYGGGYGYGGYAPAPVYYGGGYGGGFYQGPRPYYGGYNGGYRVGYNDWHGPRRGDSFYDHGPRGPRGDGPRWHDRGPRGGGDGFYRTVAPNYGRPEGRGGQWHGGQ